jgi:UDP-N-acetyl-D-mannosaminuronic acid dehydrogenase
MTVLDHPAHPDPTLATGASDHALPKPSRSARTQRFTTDVVIIGGCGHVGLPIGIAFASKGLRTRLFDVNAEAVGLVNRGCLPFAEEGAAEPLRATVRDGALQASSDPRIVQDAEHVVVVIGTPIDEHLNPDPHAIPRSLEECADYLRDGQLLVLRSTVYPGVTALVERTLAKRNLTLDVAFCPERIAEGRAMTELFSLPQIVAGRTEAIRQRAARLFSHLTDTVVPLLPEEAELAKLFTNTWRYIKFATANQFFMIANDFGLDFERIRHAVRHDYPRAADMPGAGFAAGPCLFKDTMQLAAFNKNNFVLGHSAMLINEGLPLYLVSKLQERYPNLQDMQVAVLGMAFKAESDDTRASLSYKLRRILEFSCARVICTDPYVTTDPTLVSLTEAVASADILVIAAPHRVYADLETDKPVIDVWNLRGSGARV